MIRLILLGKNGISMTRIYVTVVVCVVATLSPVWAAYKVVSQNVVTILLKPPPMIGFTLTGLMFGIVVSVLTALVMLSIINQLLNHLLMRLKEKDGDQ